MFGQLQCCTCARCIWRHAGLLGSPRAGKSGLHLVWPTVQEVRDSVEGYAAGGSIPGTVANVTKPFLQSLWRR